jgi:hypothetical protein
MAMQDEYDALMTNKTWTLVPFHGNKNVIECKWVYHIKHRADGTVLIVTKHDLLLKVLRKGMALTMKILSVLWLRLLPLELFIPSLSLVVGAYGS